MSRTGQRCPSSISLDKETFTDVTSGQRHQVDVLVKARFRDQPSCFLIHTETQSRSEADFPQRMFKYFARLHERHGLHVYPIALFSHDQPTRAEASEYCVTFPDLEVLIFRFRVVQLNRLDWQDFQQRLNPVAAALMAKMRTRPRERGELKLACLQLLGRLQLDPARQALISGFIDAYLQLTIHEEEQFAAKLEQIEPEQKEQVMEIVTSWMKKGIEQGKRQEAYAFVVRMLSKRLGGIGEAEEARLAELSIEQLEDLGESLLDFKSTADLDGWLVDRA